MQDHRTRDGLAVALTLVLPSLVTLTYFVLLARQPAGWQQAAYAVGKTIQFAFPACWAVLALREKVRWTAPNRHGLGVGLAFGLFVLVVGLSVYHLVLKPLGTLESPAAAPPRPTAQAVAAAMDDVGRSASSPAEAIRSKIRGFGVDGVWKFLAMGAFYSVFHSLLEEYYWRWFVFRQLQRLGSLTPAVVISSLGFMAHHVIVMVVYFGWSSPWTYVFSLSVAFGGAVWAWLYARSGSLYGPWLSHLLVDAAIFLIGYDLARW